MMSYLKKPPKPSRSGGVPLTLEEERDLERFKEQIDFRVKLAEGIKPHLDAFLAAKFLEATALFAELLRAYESLGVDLRCPVSTNYYRRRWKEITGTEVPE